MWYKNDNFFGLLFIVIGASLVVWGVSRFVLPIFLSISGLLLINQGLQLRHMPSLMTVAKHWFVKFRV